MLRFNPELTVLFINQMKKEELKDSISSKIKPWYYPIGSEVFLSKCESWRSINEMALHHGTL